MESKQFVLLLVLLLSCPISMIAMNSEKKSAKQKLEEMEREEIERKKIREQLEKEAIEEEKKENNKELEVEEIKIEDNTLVDDNGKEIKELKNEKRSSFNRGSIKRYSIKKRRDSIFDGIPKSHLAEMGETKLKPKPKNKKFMNMDYKGNPFEDILPEGLELNYSNSVDYIVDFNEKGKRELYMICLNEGNYYEEDGDTLREKKGNNHNFLSDDNSVYINHAGNGNHYHFGQNNNNSGYKKIAIGAGIVIGAAVSWKYRKQIVKFGVENKETIVNYIWDNKKEIKEKSSYCTIQ